MAQSVKVIIDRIEVTKDGDPSGEGELYWHFSVDGDAFATRSKNNALKISSGEIIEINESVEVVKNPGQTLYLYGSVSDKDGGFDGADEIDSFNENYNEDQNWGAGLIKERLTSGGSLDVTVYGRIELVS